MSKYIWDYPQQVFNFFNQEVNRPYQNHAKTKGWKKEILERDTVYHRIEILKRGQANFNDGHNLLTPGEKAILYCKQYTQMHVASGYYVLQKSEKIFEKYFSSGDICFIDFGCGTLTSGIALAWSYLDWVNTYEKNNRLSINYLGIDTAKPMIDKAKKFSKYSDLFNEDIYTFEFLEDFAQYDRICNFIDSNLLFDGLIVLNFSYFFASDTIDVEELVNLVKKLLDNYGEDYEIVIIFQNPKYYKLNKKWKNFKMEISLNTVIEDEEEIQYKNTTGEYIENYFPKNKSIQLKYEVLSNRNYEEVYTSIDFYALDINYKKKDVFDSISF